MLDSILGVSAIARVAVNIEPTHPEFAAHSGLVWIQLYHGCDVIGRFGAEISDS